MLLSCECDFCACFFILFYFFCNFCFQFFLKLQHSTPLYTIDDRHCSAAGCCAHNFAMFEGDDVKPILSLSFSIILALPPKREGEGTKLLQNERDGSKRDLQPAASTPLFSRPSTSPLYVTLQRHFFVPTFSFFFLSVRAVCTLRLFAFGVARTTCGICARSCASLPVCLCFFSRCHLFLLSLSLSYSLTLLFFFFLKTKRKEKKKIERKKSKRRLVVSSHGRRALVRW